jgi:hypothetical protein
MDAATHFVTVLEFLESFCSFSTGQHKGVAGRNGMLLNGSFVYALYPDSY